MPAWLREGVQRWLEIDGATLSQCLGLTRRGARVALRDHHLRSAYSTLDPRLSVAKRCDDLADRISSFQRHHWPTLRRRTKVEPAWSQLRQSLFSAFRAAEDCGIDMPTTARQLSTIVGRWK